jgi:hypothetical protein
MADRNITRKVGLQPGNRGSIHQSDAPDESWAALILELQRARPQI